MKLMKAAVWNVIVCRNQSTKLNLIDKKLFLLLSFHHNTIDIGDVQFFSVILVSPKLSKIKQFKSLLFGASEDDKKKVLKVEDSFL